MVLNDSIVVVTGASSGLGLAFSEALVARGATVFGLARREDRLHEIEAEMPGKFHGVVCDVSDEQQVIATFSDILDRTNRVDVLVNNAGFGRFGPVDGFKTEDWDEQMATNLRGVFLCSRAVIPAMKKQNLDHGFGGYIVNISSVAGLMGNPTISAYNATKFGLRGFSEALMKEVREDGIKVTCMFPGSIETEFFDVAGVPISANPMTSADITSSLVHVLETSDNYLISEITMRPLRPKG